MNPLEKLETRRYLTVDLLIGIAISGLMILYSQNFTLVGIVDAIFVAAVILFFIGWILFVSNQNLFDLLIYGVKSFWNGVAGKQNKKSYIEHLETKTMVKKSVYRAMWLSALIVAGVDMVLYGIYKLLEAGIIG
ncbi:MAG: DUF3899 domain-containing protein [Candidatus Izemoplasmatales bacterium]|nr:DUF3899 domain-containing protein [Candidatus Izemoplasmatales bacterium]